MDETVSLGFTGEYRDPVSTGYPLGQGYRWYSPSLMRFNRPDSFSPFGAAGINPYAYCNVDPINHADPSGHLPSLGRLFDAILGRRRRTEEIDRSIGVTRNDPDLRGDRSIATHNAIAGANLASPGQSGHEMQTSSLAAKRPRLELALGQPGTSSQTPRSRNLRELPNMDHLPNQWETQQHESFGRITARVNAVEERWNAMKSMPTRGNFDAMEQAGQLFENIYNAHRNIEARLDTWKTENIPRSFDLPYMKANGDTYYNFIENYVGLANRMKRLEAEWSSTYNFFLVPVEGGAA